MTRTCSDLLSAPRPQTVLLWADRAITTMALNPVCVWELAVAAADGSVSLYDRRMIQPQQNGELKPWAAGLMTVRGWEGGSRETTERMAF